MLEIQSKMAVVMVLNWLCCLQTAFILPSMKVDSSISHQVLDRIKVSQQHLGQNIYRPGEDRCFKGNALGQLVPQQASVPMPVVEPVVNPFVAPVAVVEPSSAPVTPALPVAAVAPPPLAEEGEGVQQLELEVVVLKEATSTIQATLEEIRSEVGKLAANSRRELVRIGKRIDQLEQRKPSAAELSPLDATRWSAVEKLQQRVTEIEARPRPPAGHAQRDDEHDVDSEACSEESSETLLQRLEQIEGQLSQSVGKIEAMAQAQLENRELVELGEMIAALQQAVEVVQQVQIEQGSQVERQAEKLYRLQRQFDQSASGAGAESDATKQQHHVLKQVQKRVIALEAALAEHVAAAVPIAALEVEVENPLSKTDGREKSIVEELRYEIGEVRKSSSRQLEAINSKLNQMATSSEVSEMIRHSTQQLQQRVDDIQQKLQQSRSPEAVSTAIRF
jgi:hypothetical protein